MTGCPMSESKTKGELFVISGPSGVGKGTICKRLAESDARIVMSVSATTRPPRPAEIEGVHYFFKTREEFERMIASDELLEYMDVFGTNYYGTPRAFVDEKIAAGMDVILEIDVNGAMNVKNKRPEAVTVFIAPPSLAVLHARLAGRGTETPEQIERRYSKARLEMSFIPKYDYVVVNDELNGAVEDVLSIMRAERLRTSRRADTEEIMKED